MMIKDLITTTEAAAILGCDPSTLRHRIRKGKLKAERVGRDHLVSRRVIEIERHNKQLKSNNIIELPRRYCPNCRASITDTDVEAGYCTQCQREL